MGEELRAEVQRKIDWYEAKGRKMKTSEYQLALAFVIGATTALSDLLEKFAPPSLTPNPTSLSQGEK